MKQFTRIPKWALAVGAAALLVTAQQGVQADPSDDFSFTLTRAPQIQTRFMSEGRISSILRDQLDISLSRRQSRRLAHHLVKLCKRYGFDPAFILSMVQVESNFRVGVVSPAGAIGLMQLMPATAALVARQEGIAFKGPRSLKEPYMNLSLGIAYLSKLKEHYHGLPQFFHVAAYNIGPARLDELLSRKSFKPVNTRIYYEKIRRGIPAWRNYQAKAETVSGRVPGQSDDRET